MPITSPVSPQWIAATKGHSSGLTRFAVRMRAGFPFLDMTGFFGLIVPLKAAQMAPAPTTTPAPIKTSGATIQLRPSPACDGFQTVTATPSRHWECGAEQDMTRGHSHWFRQISRQNAPNPQILVPHGCGGTITSSELARDLTEPIVFALMASVQHAAVWCHLALARR